MSDINLFDQYSILHLATGIIAYFWRIKFTSWFIIHLLFEIIENQTTSMEFINMYFPQWPGGKAKADTLINSVSDQFFAMLGWIIGYMADYYGNKYELYAHSSRAYDK